MRVASGGDLPTASQTQRSPDSDSTFARPSATDVSPCDPFDLDVLGRDRFGRILWTPALEEWFAKNYLRSNKPALAARLGCSQSSLYRKAVRMGVVSTGFCTPTRQKDAWAARDVTYLRDYYQKLPTSEIARKLGRTVTAVHDKAHKIGKTKRRLTGAALWPPEALAYLDEHYGMIPTATLTKHLNKSASQIYSKAYDLGLTRRVAKSGRRKQIG